MHTQRHVISWLVLLAAFMLQEIATADPADPNLAGRVGIISASGTQDLKVENPGVDGQRPTIQVPDRSSFQIWQGDENVERTINTSPSSDARHQVANIVIPESGDLYYHVTGIYVGGGGAGGNGWAADYRRGGTRILSAPKYIMADASYSIPVYFQVGSDREKHIKILSISGTMILNGGQPHTLTVDYLAAGDYVTNGTPWTGAEKQARRWSTTGSNNSRADYTAIISPDSFKGIQAGTGNDVTNDITISLSVTYQVDGQGPSMTDQTDPVHLGAFIDDHVPAVPLGYIDANGQLQQSRNYPMTLPRPDTGTPLIDPYRMRDRVYRDAVQTFADVTNNRISLNGSPLRVRESETSSIPGLWVGTVYAPVFTLSCSYIDYRTIQLSASATDDINDLENGVVPWKYSAADGGGGCNGQYVEGGLVGQRVGATATTYFGYRAQFSGFLPGGNNPASRDGKLLDLRIRSGTMSHQLFYADNTANSPHYVWLSVDATDSNAPAVLSATANGFGVIAGIMTICTASGPPGWAVGAAIISVLAGGLEIWGAVTPTGNDDERAVASVGGFYQWQTMDGSNDPLTPVSANISCSINRADASGEKSCKIIAANEPTVRLKTWTGWLEFGCKTTIQLESVILSNTASATAKFYYNNGLQTSGAAFIVNVTDINAIDNNNEIFDSGDYYTSN